jgi:hypothetical protein
MISNNIRNLKIQLDYGMDVYEKILDLNWFGIVNTPMTLKNTMFNEREFNYHLNNINHMFIKMNNGDQMEISEYSLYISRIPVEILSDIFPFILNNFAKNHCFEKTKDKIYNFMVICLENYVMTDAMIYNLKALIKQSRPFVQYHLIYIIHNMYGIIIPHYVDNIVMKMVDHQINKDSTDMWPMFQEMIGNPICY